MRGESRQRVDDLLGKVKNCARGAALSIGARVEFPPPKTPDLEASRINPSLNAVFASNLAAHCFQPRQVTEEPIGASNDLSNVSQLVPTSEITIPIGPKGLQAHTIDFVEATGSETAFDALILGAKAEVCLAIDLLTNPGLLTQVQEDFRAQGDMD